MMNLSIGWKICQKTDQIKAYPFLPCLPYAFRALGKYHRNNQDEAFPCKYKYELSSQNTCIFRKYSFLLIQFQRKC